MGRSAKSITLIRDLIQKFDQLAHDAESRNDHRSATEAHKQRMYAVEKLLEYEQAGQREHSKHTSESGLKRIPFEMMDSILNSVSQNYSPCPLCGSFSRPKPTKTAPEISPDNHAN